jgi:hypothetical protein
MEKVENMAEVILYDEGKVSWLYIDEYLIDLKNKGWNR